MTNQYLLKEKKISDIRIFEERSIFPKNYNFPKDYLILATYFVDQIKENKFKLKGNSYFMINFTPKLPHNKIIFEKETMWDQDSKGSQEVNVGVDPKIFNSLPEKEKGIFIVKLVAKILREYLKKYNIDTRLINDIELKLLQSKEIS